MTKPPQKPARRWVTVPFSNSAHYWDTRYRHGGDSGAGSYGKLASYKADIINAFIKNHGINSVIEFGCGDGNQLSMIEYSRYIGVDVSHTSVDICRKKFADDPTKLFLTLFEYEGQRCDLSLSLDVIFHLVEDEVFEGHMSTLFAASHRYVIIYSSNHDGPTTSHHVRHRHFSTWIEHNVPYARLLHHIPNRFPYDPQNPDETTLSDFFIYEVIDKK